MHLWVPNVQYVQDFSISWAEVSRCRRQTVFSACSPCFNLSCSAITVSREIIYLDADTLVELLIQYALRCLLSDSVIDSLIQVADSVVPALQVRLVMLTFHVYGTPRPGIVSCNITHYHS